MKRNNHHRPIWKLAIVTGILALSLWPSLIAGRGGVLVNVRMMKCPWGDCLLGNRLEHYLSTMNNIPTTTNSEIITGDRANHQVDFNGLLLEGLNQNSDYLVDIFVDRIDFEKRRIVVFPQILARYRVYAIISGTCRMVDIKNQRLIKLNDFKYEIKTRDRWHLYDDDPHDPDLDLPADEKNVLLRAIEDKAAQGLFKDIKEMANGENLGKN